MLVAEVQIRSPVHATLCNAKTPNNPADGRRELGGKLHEIPGKTEPMDSQSSVVSIEAAV